MNNYYILDWMIKITALAFAFLNGFVVSYAVAQRSPKLVYTAKRGQNENSLVKYWL